MESVYAVSDVHSPRFLPLFRQALSRAPQERPCLVILAGDLIDRGKVDMLKYVVDGIMAKWGNVRLVAVFGNEEYHDIRGVLVENYNSIRWLNDEVEFYECGDRRVAIVGTQGSLDRLTSWQSKHMPWLAEEYRRRPSIIAKLVTDARRDADIVILVSHYVLASGNLKGEDPRIWPEMYSKLMERVVAETRPNIAIHGHAHLGRRYTLVNGIPVYNVALPAVKEVTVIKLRRDLTIFLK